MTATKYFELLPTTDFLKEPEIIDFVPVPRSQQQYQQNQTKEPGFPAARGTGQSVQAQLQLMNDSWGLDYFHLLHKYSEYSSTKCGPFIASLPHDVQLFVFQSILALDGVEGLDSEMVRRTGSRLHALVVNAAPEFKKTFLGPYQSELAHEPDIPGPDRDRLRMICDKLAEWDDAVDSLKAGQMETLRLWNKFSARAHDMGPQLEERLEALYSRVSEGARRALQLAEYYYVHNQEPDDYTPAITYFHRAFEAEFRQSLLARLELRMRKARQIDYGNNKAKLMVGGRLYRNLTFGEALHFINKDPVLFEFVNELGFDAEQLCRRSSELNKARNDAIHGIRHTRADAEDVREILLGKPSILALLFPELSP